HRKVINGKLWEQAPHQIPVCVDCHQPHKARKAYYDQGMANRDCLSCHAKAGLASAAGHPLTVAARELSSSMHRKVACAQCHTGVAPSRTRPCETVVKKV
ncbi:MAG: cytochrome c3 family protein, partial [bacterium]